jgi:hypothetical protein
VPSSIIGTGGGLVLSHVGFNGRGLRTSLPGLSLLVEIRPTEKSRPVTIIVSQY